MPSRLALIGCRAPHEGPWTIAKGNESRIEVFGLGQGESIRLEMEIDGSLKTHDYLQSGLHLWPDPRSSRYRVCKVVSDGSPRTPTTVRILLNGKH